MGKDGLDLQRKDQKTGQEAPPPDFSDQPVPPKDGPAPVPAQFPRPADQGGNGAATPDGKGGLTTPDGSATPVAMTPETLRNLETAGKSIVQVTTDTGLGSGYIADENGRIVTDSHVIIGAREIFVTTADGKRYRAGLENIDDLEDTATLKLLGPEKSPLPPLKVGDAAKLNPGDPVFALGHPLGEPDIVVTKGRYMGGITPYEFFSAVEPRFDGILANKYRFATTEGKKDLETAFTRPALLLDMNTHHGDSGGPYVNAQGELVGVVQAGGVGFSIGAPSDRIQGLFNTPGKFQVKHGFEAERWANSYERSLSSDPLRTISLTAATTVPVGALGYYAMLKAPKMMGGAFALQGTFSMMEDLPTYWNSTNSRDSWKSGVASGADALEIVGGIAMFFPRARTFGMITSAVGLTGRIGADFIPNRYVVESITRKDGTNRGPFNWNTMEQ
jgi:hypothetical protein